MHPFTTKQNYFESLNQSLESEGLLNSFPLGANISYGETFSYDFDNGSKHGYHVSIFRDSDGRYERPVHYAR